MLLTALAAALDDDECRNVGLAPFTLFINLASHLRPRIQWMTKDPTTPPVTLDKPVAALIAHATQLTVDTVELLWSRLRLFLWALPPRSMDALQDTLGLHEIFMTAGLHFEIGFCDLFPPTSVCLDPHCNVAGGTPRTLANPLSYKITLFSRDLGPLPAWCYSLNCPHCFTRYYPTYFVHSNRGLRTYYPYFNLHELHVIEVATHYYMEASLARRFTNMSVCSWVSSTNNAKIYNLEYDNATTQAVANSWDLSVEMSSDMAMDGLLLLGLLRDTVERQVMLTLNQNAPNNHDRLRPALEERTARMVGPGQEYWNHACTGCCEVNQDTKQALRAVVTDGIAMGHACCGVHDCQIPLASQRARFCPAHSEQDLRCAVVGCSAPTERPFKTCNNSAHRELENRGEESRTALFQLKRRLERQKVAVPSDSFADAVSNDDESIEEDCPDKPEEGHNHTTKMRICLGRSWSHNEEICVGCCGMILGRATFFGSEAPNAVRIFHHILFPTKASLPAVMFYDNNKLTEPAFVRWPRRLSH
ncbi:hypothetical protein BDZ89DRAFT_1070862 [Hymenopellis radicata]|nr:hypothetical protein BDZ89DRAFT_1070862 [Hymenopellis radicata]